jgi:hypothetical protein
MRLLRTACWVESLHYTGLAQAADNGGQMDRNDGQIRAATDLGLAILPYAHGRERRLSHFFM